MNSITITTLVENSPGDHRSLKAEHGISFHIQPGNGPALLFDTGQTGLLISNARYLSVDLEAVEQVVLSHGHYDHTGGLVPLLHHVKSRPSIHVGQGFFNPKYSVNGPGKNYLGMNFSKADVYAVRCALVEHREDTTEIAPGIFLITNFHRNLDPDWPNPRFVIPSTEKTEQWVTDPFTDEVSLVLRTPRGLVLLVGCSHPGILNIMDTVRSRFKEPLYAVLGGTHLVEADNQRLTRVLDYLETMPDLVLGMSHCTGSAAMEKIKQRCPGYYHNFTGSSLIID